MPVSPYASGTTVPVHRTMDELAALLRKHGASQYASGWDSTGHRIMFSVAGRAYRFDVRAATAAETSRTPTGRVRDKSTAAQLAEQETARRLRSLLLVVKALMVGVDDGILSLHDALLPWTVLPDGSTMGEWAGPQLDAAYEDREMPSLLGRLELEAR